MIITIEGNPDEFAALVLELQEQQSVRPRFVPETANEPCDSAEMVATGVSDTAIPMSFKKAREKCGLTQQEVATRLGIDQSAVCLWETGKTKPRSSQLLKIAELYNCTVEELLRGHPETAEQ